MTEILDMKVFTIAGPKKKAWTRVLNPAGSNGKTGRSINTGKAIEDTARK